MLYSDCQSGRTAAIARHVSFAQIIFYFRQDKRGEHWRRLRDWSFCPSVCVHDDLSSSSPHVIHNQRWRLPV